MGNIVAIRKPHECTGQPTKTQMKILGRFVVIDFFLFSVGLVAQMEIYRNHDEDNSLTV